MANDTSTNQLTDKLARALREVKRQASTGEIVGIDLQQVDSALEDYDAAKAEPAAEAASGECKPLPGYRHFEVMLPGFVDAASTKGLRAVVEAPNLASIRAIVPAYSVIEPLPELVETDEVDFIVPINAAPLRDWSVRSTAMDAPADAVSLHAYRLARLTRALCDSHEPLTPQQRHDGRAMAESLIMSATQHLVVRAQIKAHHDGLNHREEPPTGDDFNEVVDLTGVKIAHPFGAQL